MREQLQRGRLGCHHHSGPARVGARSSGTGACLFHPSSSGSSSLTWVRRACRQICSTRRAGSWPLGRCRRPESEGPGTTFATRAGAALQRVAACASRSFSEQSMQCNAAALVQDAAEAARLQLESEPILAFALSLALSWTLLSYRHGPTARFARCTERVHSASCGHDLRAHERPPAASTRSTASALAARDARRRRRVTTLTAAQRASEREGRTWPSCARPPRRARAERAAAP